MNSRSLTARRNFSSSTSGLPQDSPAVRNRWAGSSGALLLDLRAYGMWRSGFFRFIRDSKLDSWPGRNLLPMPLNSAPANPVTSR
jgi:hypothetical protein